MTVEFAAVCRREIDLRVVARAAELWFAVLLERPGPIILDLDVSPPEMRIGSAGSVAASVLGPGSHEFADSWVLMTGLIDRDPATWCLGALVAALSAELFDGRLLDEAAVLPSGTTASDLLVDAVSSIKVSATDVQRRIRRQ